MCRWIALLSNQHDVSLHDALISPSNGIVQLSKDASFHPGSGSTNNHVMNGDGFGVGWYYEKRVLVSPYDENRELVQGEETKRKGQTTAAVFRDTQPAWSNLNLHELVKAVHTRCFIAHVRAASAFTGISQVNCHPFKAGRLLFCHNGRIENFPVIRRALMQKLTDEAFISVRGTTDSECIFALILTFLTKDSPDGISPFQQTAPFEAKRLVNAVKKALRSIEILMDEAGIYDTTYSTFNFCLMDGDTIVATRFCDKSPRVPPPSLYMAFGNAERLYYELTHEDATLEAESVNNNTSDDNSSDDDGLAEGEDYAEKQVCLTNAESRPGRLYNEVDPATACLIVASCPLTKTHTWTPLPKNSILWYERGQLPELRLLKHERRISMVEQ